MTARTLLTYSLVLFAGTACQCGGSVKLLPDGGVDPNNGGDEPVLLALSPADAAYVTDGVTPATGTYTATATYRSGRTEDVTARTAFYSDNLDIGAFTGANFSSTLDRGGKVRVSAIFGSLNAATNLTVTLRRSAVDPKSTNVPTNPGAKFTGTPVAARAPDLVYPNDGVLLPPNLGRLEIHFLPGASNTLFELSLKSTYTDLKIYMRCATPLNGGCIYEPDNAVWRAMAVTNRGAGEVTLTLKGTDDAGSAVGESAPIKLLFSNDDIQGGLYYWTTTTKAIMRFDFAAPTQLVAEKFADAATVGGGTDCIGCHALSRDGRKMVIEAQGSTDGRVALMNVATRSKMVPFPAPNKSFFSSWNPDASRYVGVDDRAADFNLRIFDGSTGQLVESIANTGDMARAANHPDWSPDGNAIVYARVSRKGPRGVSLQWPTHGQINLVTKQPNGSWSAPVEIAPAVAGKNRYYPAISPSNDFVVFNESTCIAGTGDQDYSCDGDADPSATLFAAKLEANAARVELVRANAPGKRDGGKKELTNSFPKWSPFNFQRTGEIGSRLQWLTFSSTRAYGLRTPGTLMWLWMVAIDPAKVAAGEDASYPAFCLPFQDLSTSNHIAQWTQVVVPIIN